MTIVISLNLFVNVIYRKLVSLPEILQIILLVTMLGAFWFHSPPLRDQWTWLLWGLPPLFTWQAVRGRVWQSGAWQWWGALLLLFLLMAWNYHAAPYRRAEFWVLVARPLFGFALVTSCWYWAQQPPQGRALWWVTACGGVLLGALALTATQWTGKSALFAPLTNALPRLNYRAFAPDTLLSFNPNEIGGALAMAVPLLLGLALVPRCGRALRALCLLGALLTGVAAVLGMSRFALFGITLGSALLLLGVLRGRWRWLVGVVLAAGAMSFVVVFALTADPDLPTDRLLSARDSTSVSTRLQLWARSLDMVTDYPLTGVGMAMFRHAIRLPAYQIPYFEHTNFAAPHAHNALFQSLTDFGVAGGLLLIGISASLAWQWARALRRATTPDATRSLLAVGAGLLGYACYNMGDTIAMWDRLAFVGWWGLGLAQASFLQVQQETAPKIRV